MRVLLCGGGTGGHVNPALAIADMVRRNHPDSEIAFVGTKRGIENKLVPHAGYPLYHVNIQGRQGNLIKNIKTAYLTLTSPRKAAKLLREFRPDLVIGTGGYACYPTVKAATRLGIPTMLHESNAMPGMAVRMLQREVDTILLNFEATRDKLDTSCRVVRVGNPISARFYRADKQQARRALDIPQDAKMVLSFGGSLGAEAVNNACFSLMKSFCAKENVYHVHATGSGYYESLSAEFRRQGLHNNPRLSLNEYLYDMPLYMAAADAVICRAGAMTLSELAAMRKAAVLVPSPNVTDQHQLKNAKVLSDAGAAILIEEKDLDERTLTDAIASLVQEDILRHGIEEKIAPFAEEDAGKRIYEEIVRLVNR